MKIIFYIPLFFLLACTPDEVKIPEDIIQKEEMIEIYRDVHISDALVNYEKVKDVKVANQLKKSFLASVLKKHNVTIEAYEKSNAFYEKHETIMLELYEEIMIRNSEEQALLEGEKIEDIKNKPKEEPKK